MQHRHVDCKNFAGVDAAKGICRWSETMLENGGASCERFSPVKKCGNCRHFTAPDEKGMGRCGGLGKEAWTFASLSAVACEGHAFV